MKQGELRGQVGLNIEEGSWEVRLRGSLKPAYGKHARDLFPLQAMSFPLGALGHTNCPHPHPAFLLSSLIL